MTNKEAIDAIDIAMAEVEWNYSLDYQIAFDMAKKALEKQIPKRPRNVHKQNIFGWECECGEFVWVDECYCSNCGQKIDWEGVK